MMSINSLVIGLVVLLSVEMALGQSIRATVDSTQLLIGDQFHLDVWADMPAGTTAAWPLFADTLTSTIEILEASVQDTVRKENGDFTVHQRLVLTSFDTGFMVVPSLPFLFNNDSTQLAFSDSFLVLVTEFPVDMDKEIMDIKGPMDVPVDWKKYIIYGLIAFVIIGLLIVAFLYWKKHRKPKAAPAARPIPTRPAHEIALEKLETLRLKKLWQNDRSKEYYIELSDVVREYIEFRYGIMALELTTDETVRALQLKGADAELIKSLKGMMQLADLAKFAKYRPMADENDRSFDIAKEFVTKTIVVEKPTEPTVQKGES